MEEKRYNSIKEELEKSIAQTKCENQESVLSKALDFIHPYKLRLKEIELFPDYQRELALKDIKNDFFISIIKSSIIFNFVPNQYKEIIEDEMWSIVNAK